MTYHIHLKDYTCPKCSEMYMPYKKDLPCPKCGTVNEVSDIEYFDFITDVLQSMKAHKYEYDRYTPDGWYQGSYTEYLQSITFELFDFIENSKVEDKKTYLVEIIDKQKIELSQKNHIKEVELAIYDEYKKNPIKFNPIKRIFWKWLKNKLP